MLRPDLERCPYGFSSLAATRDWLETDMAKAFMRAYQKTRIYMNETPATEIAKVENPYFLDMGAIEALTSRVSSAIEARGAAPGRLWARVIRVSDAGTHRDG
jgi:ABC-type nitrate/sulfonate/bicarbonate transport system substrate-binding protein